MRACDPRPSQDALDLELNGAEQLGEGMYSESPKDTLHAVSPPSSHTHTTHTTHRLADSGSAALVTF